MEMNSINQENHGPTAHGDEKTFAFFYDSAGYKFFWKGLSQLLGWGPRTPVPMEDDISQEDPTDN